MGNVVAIIPARSGSKSVKDKNIRLMNGKPMLAYSIEQALCSASVDRVVVSTDSERYRAIAREYGAEVPFLRPAEISQDSSLDLEVFQHAIRWLRENEGCEPELCVHLRPTHPIRDPADIDDMVSMLREHREWDSVRSVSPAKQVPYKMWLFSDERPGEMDPLVTCGIPDAYNAPRQQLPKVYMQNACIDVVRACTIMDKASMSGDRIGGYKMDYDFDVDTEADFLNAERAMTLLSAKRDRRALKICCDIDGVLAAKTPGNDYGKASPMERNIELINRLYEQGHHIVLFTARGYATGLDWKKVTQDQMRAWGVKHHELLFGKPDADIYIDDKFFEIAALSEAL